MDTLIWLQHKEEEQLNERKKLKGIEIAYLPQKAHPTSNIVAENHGTA